MEIFDAVLAFAVDFTDGIFANLHSRLFLIYLATSVIIAYWIYLRSAQRRSVGFLRFLLPAEYYRDQSTWTDVKLFLVGRLLTGLGLFRAGVTVFAAITVLNGLSAFIGTPPTEGDPSALTILLATLVIVVTSDFFTYWIHRIHHENMTLWPFHSVHHSAEVMTPITVYRKHPVYDLFSALVRGFVLGVLQGLLLFVSVGVVDLWTIGGANIFYVLFNLLGSNLRHSHIWLSFGPVWSYVFISPAQHQIHHSRAIEHHNKNYGEVFAIWDWMFGTLYVPECEEKLEFGLSDRRGEPIPQPHATLRDALIEPFQSSAKALRRRMRARQTDRAR